MLCFVYIFSDSKCKYLTLLKLEIQATFQYILSWILSSKWLVYCVPGGERCDPEGVKLLLWATTGSDLLVRVVVVADLFELAIRKPAAAKTTTTTTEQTYFIRYLVVKINVS